MQDKDVHYYNKLRDQYFPATSFLVVPFASSRNANEFAYPSTANIQIRMKPVLLVKRDLPGMVPKIVVLLALGKKFCIFHDMIILKMSPLSLPLQCEEGRGVCISFLPSPKRSRVVLYSLWVPLATGSRKYLQHNKIFPFFPFLASIPQNQQKPYHQQ